MSDGDLVQIPWSSPDPDHRSLGRHIRHDPRNRAHRASSVRAEPTGDVRHRNYGRKLYQDGVGACTAFAAGHFINCSPTRQRRRPKPNASNADCFHWYGIATTKDPWPGSYPPDDTGSSGQAACEALVSTGNAAGYEWAFGYDEGLATLPQAPWMQGTWWTIDMFYPTKTGRVTPTGSDAGGHEYLWIGSEEYGRRLTGGSRRRRSWFLNSWQESPRNTWGRDGYFWLDEDDHRSLLARQGDLVRPVLTAA